jgi:hypothetical protein
VTLPAKFTPAYVARTPTSTLVSDLSNLLFATCEASFGVKKVAQSRHQEKPAVENKALQELRVKKNDLKRARKMFVRNGDTSSCAYRVLTKQWHDVMHQHSRLARALKQHAKSRENTNQQRNFRRDPRRFCKKLFEKKLSGEPDFPEEKAFDYFSGLYHDKNRGEAVHALPEMKSPPKPVHVFPTGLPTDKEIQDVIKTKRNAAAPGLDGITYVPYKRCPALIPTLKLLFDKIWTSGDIPRTGELRQFNFWQNQQS